MAKVGYAEREKWESKREELERQRDKLKAKRVALKDKKAALGRLNGSDRDLELVGDELDFNLVDLQCNSADLENLESAMAVAYEGEPMQQWHTFAYQLQKSISKLPKKPVFFNDPNPILNAAVKRIIDDLRGENDLLSLSAEERQKLSEHLDTRSTLKAIIPRDLAEYLNETAEYRPLI